MAVAIAVAVVAPISRDSIIVSIPVMAAVAVRGGVGRGAMIRMAIPITIPAMVRTRHTGPTRDNGRQHQDSQYSLHDLLPPQALVPERDP